jgi:hypothetical protein
MEERRKMAEGLIAAHVISFTIAVFTTLIANLFTGLIVFALSLPPAAYISPEVLDKLT